MTDEYSRLARGMLERLELRDELEDLLQSLIPVLDSFDRIDAHARDGWSPDDPAALLTTVERIASQLRGALGEAGLVVFGEPGDSVDLSRYEIVGVKEDADAAKDTVVEVVRRGYQRDGRVFRPAEVIVVGQEEESRP